MPFTLSRLAKELPKLTVLHRIVLLFLLAQSLALFTAYFFGQYMNANQDIVQLPYAPNEAGSVLLLAGYIVVGTAALLLLIKFYRGEFIYKAIEFFMIFSAATLFFIAVLVAVSNFFWGLSLVDYGDQILMAATGLGFFFALGKFVMPSMKNAAAILASASVGALFGLTLGLVPAVLFAAVMSFYDFFAVFISKHMVTLAKEISRQQLSFSIAASEKLEGRERLEFRKRLSHLGKEDRQYVKDTYGDSKKMELGTGDITIPAMLGVAAMVDFGPWAALAVALGSAAGLFFLLSNFSRKNLFLPALPPIVSSGLVALLVYLVIFAKLTIFHF